MFTLSAGSSFLPASYHFGNSSLIFGVNETERVIARGTLKEFWVVLCNNEQQLKAWYSVAQQVDWASPQDIKIMFPTVSILSDDLVVFNIKGNHYRLIVKINYAYRVIWIRFIGNHAEYAKINANTK